MDAVPFLIATMGPGVAILVVGIALAARGMAGNQSVKSARLMYLGFALIMLGPGLGIAGAVATGDLMWPALIGAAVPIIFGVGILYGLKLHWNDPSRGSLDGRSSDIDRR